MECFYCIYKCYCFPSGSFYVLVDIWGLANGPWLSGLTCWLGVGSLVAPLIAGPFISTKDNVQDANNSFMAQDNNLTTNNSTSTLEPHRMNMLKAYAITSSIVLFSGIVFLLAAYITYQHWEIVSHSSSEGSKLIQQKAINETKSTNRAKRQRFQVSFEHIFGMLICLVTLAHCLIEHTIGMFMVTFAVEYCQWTKVSAVFLLTIFFVVATISRGVCALLAKWIVPEYILVILISITICSAVALVFGSPISMVMLWLCICGFAVGNPPLFPVGVTYCNQYMIVGATLNAFLQLACTTAAIASPLTFGSLYESIGPVSFVYILLVASCLLVVIFACMHVLGYRRGKRTAYQTTEIQSEMPEENGTMLKSIDKE